VDAFALTHFLVECKGNHELAFKKYYEARHPVAMKAMDIGLRIAGFEMATHPFVVPARRFLSIFAQLTGFFFICETVQGYCENALPWMRGYKGWPMKEPWEFYEEKKKRNAKILRRRRLVRATVALSILGIATYFICNKYQISLPIPKLPKLPQLM
jgi:hypothetical protein